MPAVPCVILPINEVNFFAALAFLVCKHPCCNQNCPKLELGKGAGMFERTRVEKAVNGWRIAEVSHMIDLIYHIRSMMSQPSPLLGGRAAVGKRIATP